MNLEYIYISRRLASVRSLAHLSRSFRNWRRLIFDIPTIHGKVSRVLSNYRCGVIQEVSGFWFSSGGSDLRQTLEVFHNNKEDGSLSSLLPPDVVYIWFRDALYEEHRELQAFTSQAIGKTITYTLYILSIAIISRIPLCKAASLASTPLLLNHCLILSVIVLRLSINYALVAMQSWLRRQCYHGEVW